MKWCQTDEYKQKHSLGTRVNSSYKTELIQAGGSQVQNEYGLPVKPNFRKQTTKLHTQTESECVLWLRAIGEALARPAVTLGMLLDFCKHLRATATFLSMMIEYCLPKEDLAPGSHSSIQSPCYQKGFWGISEKHLCFLTTQKKVWLLGFYWTKYCELDICS